MNFQDCDAKHVASDCLFLAVAIQVPLSTAATSDKMRLGFKHPAQCATSLVDSRGSITFSPLRNGNSYHWANNTGVQTWIKFESKDIFWVRSSCWTVQSSISASPMILPAVGLFTWIQTKCKNILVANCKELTNIFMSARSTFDSRLGPPVRNKNSFFFSAIFSSPL